MEAGIVASKFVISFHQSKISQVQIKLKISFVKPLGHERRDGRSISNQIPTVLGTQLYKDIKRVLNDMSAIIKRCRGEHSPLNGSSCH